VNAHEISIGKAKIALSTSADRIEANRIAFLNIPDSLPNLYHDSGPIGSQDMGQTIIRACQSLTIPYVDVIERRRLKPNNGLGRGGQAGFINVLVAKFIYASVLVDPNRFQVSSVGISITG
jgi:hypothetical protein